jgi:guanylate kinase
MSSRRRGLLFIVSAPSGAGKTTLVERLVQILPNLRMSRSYTSRAARDGEQRVALVARAGELDDPEPHSIS